MVVVRTGALARVGPGGCAPPVSRLGSAPGSFLARRGGRPGELGPLECGDDVVLLARRVTSGLTGKGVPPLHLLWPNGKSATACLPIWSAPRGGTGSGAFEGRRSVPSQAAFLVAEEIGDIPVSWSGTRWSETRSLPPRRSPASYAVARSSAFGGNPTEPPAAQSCERASDPTCPNTPSATIASSRGCRREGDLHKASVQFPPAASGDLSPAVDSRTIGGKPGFAYPHSSEIQRLLCT